MRTVIRLALLAALTAGAPSLAHAQVLYPQPTTGTVSTAATIVTTPGKKVTKVCNTTASGGGNIWLNPSGGTPSAGLGDEVAPGGCVSYNGTVANANSNAITGISDSGTASYTITIGN